MHFTIAYEQFESASALAADEQALLNAARQAAEGAYAPFSRFKVGCAVQLVSGEVMSGNNQENKAFPSGICAERTVLFYAGSQGRGKDIRKIAVTAKSLQTKIMQPVTPCGACRQVMLEYEQMAGEPFILILQGESGPVLRLKGVGESLLPFGFDVEF